MFACKLTIAWCISISFNFVAAQTLESCNRHVPRSKQNDHALLQITKFDSTAMVTFESTSTVVVRMKTFRQNPSNVASVIQCGIQAILSATMHFSVTPPRIAEGIFTLGDELLTCIENILTPGQQALDGAVSFRQAWQNSFEAIPEAAASITHDLEWYTRDGYAPALIRAIGTIIGTAGEVVTNFLPADVAGEVLKYLNAVVETFDTLGTSWDEFAKGNTVEGIEAIYWGLRSITDGMMPEVLKNNTVYSTIIGTLDFVIGNLSQHVLEYERLILESNVCWRTEKTRGRVRPQICPSDQYVSDGAGYCYPLQSSLISVSSPSSLDSALQRKGGSQDGGHTPGHNAIPARCDMDGEFNEKHGTYCYTPCNNGWQQKQDHVLKCISACEGKFPAESQGMCGRDSGIIAKAIMEMVTVVLNSAFSLAENIIKMQQHGVSAELLTDTIQVFIDMGKPFARPLCPEGEAPTPAPNPIACTMPCSPGFGPTSGQCRLLTGDLIICLPAQADGLCAAGQVACPPTPAPTLALETTAPTLVPTGWVNGGRRRTPAPTPSPTTMLLPATPLPTSANSATPAPTNAAMATPVPTNAAMPTQAPTNAETATPDPTNASVATPASTDGIATPSPISATSTLAPTDAIATPAPTVAISTPVPTDAPTDTPTNAPTDEVATPEPTSSSATPTPAPTDACDCVRTSTAGLTLWDADYASSGHKRYKELSSGTYWVELSYGTYRLILDGNDSPEPCACAQAQTPTTPASTPASPAPVCQNGILSGDICCAASCGTCGGAGCGSRPGGASQCCAGLITSACTSTSQVACKVQQADEVPAGLDYSDFDDYYFHDH